VINFWPIKKPPYRFDERAVLVLSAEHFAEIFVVMQICRVDVIRKKYCLRIKGRIENKTDA